VGQLVADPGHDLKIIWIAKTALDESNRLKICQHFDNGRPVPR